MGKKEVKAPAYQWYPKDILTSVRVAALKPLEELWYRRALDFCWLNVTLPNDPQLFAQIIGRGCTVEGARAVMAMFEVHKKDATKLVHDRQQKERQKQAKNRRQHSAAGKASAAKRRKQRELEAQNEGNGRSTDVDVSLQRNSTLLTPTPVTSKEEEIRGASATPPSPPEPPADTRHEHPAIVAIREVSGKYPPKNTWDEIIGLMGVNVDVVRLKKCFVQWQIRGYKPVNYGWATDWYANDHIPEQGKGNGTNRNNSSGSRPTPAETIASRPYR